MERRLAAILAADVVGYSRLMGKNEAATLAALKEHRQELIDAKIAEHQGRIVKLTGDGMLVEFPSVVNAVTCAAEIQRKMLERNVDVPEDRRIEFRIGVNLGDVIVEGNDIFGDGVNVAARLEGTAMPGGIAVSATVRDHIGNRVDLAFEDAGEHALKNIEQPVRVYRVALVPPSAGLVGARRVMEESNRTKPSVAVLPFNNISGDPEQEYFSDGITEDIITDLSKVSGLHVVARNTVFTYKSRSIKVQQAAKELGVRFVLEGSVRKVGQRVRISGQLIDANDGGHLWAERYDRDLTDIFAIQDEITRTIVDQLKVKLLPEERKEIEAAPTENIEAYTYYLQGRQFFHMHTKHYAVLARRMFAKAVECDPLYARAYAGIANSDWYLYTLHNVEIAAEDVLATSAKALELDPDLAEAHAARGNCLRYSRRDEEAMAEFEQAIALDPNLFEGRLFYGWFCVNRGHFETACRHLEWAAELSRDDYRVLLALRYVYKRLGRQADSEAVARRGLEAAERELKLHPENPHPATEGACALAALGESDRAKEWASRALAIDPDDPAVLYNIACFYSLLGDLDQSIDLLERLLPDFNHDRKAKLKIDPDLDPIRSHPRYQTLVPMLE